MIGQPFDHVTAVDNGNGDGWNIRFTDGTTLLNWSQAAAAGWVSDALVGWDSSTGGFNVKYDGLGEDDSLRPGKAYWIQTAKDNIAMIVPAVTPVL